MQPAALEHPVSARQSSPSAWRLVGTLPFPIEVDRHGIGANGIPWPRNSDGPLTFAFADRGRDFAALVMRTGDEIRVHLSGEIMPMPFTIESPGGRQQLLRLMRALIKLPFGRVKLDSRRNICIEADLSIAPPFTPNRLIAAAALFIARTRAVVDRVAAEKPRPAKAAAGAKAPAARQIPSR